MPVAKLQDVDLYYEVTGTGFPLVLLHTGWAGVKAWSKNVPALAEKYQVINYDHRGVGNSHMTDGSRDDRPWAKGLPGEVKPAAQSIVTWAWDLYGLLKHLGIERTYLCGCSDGCCVSLEFCFARPEMVEAAILMSGNPFGFLHDRPGFSCPVPDRRWDLPALKMPIRYIHGEKDIMMPPAMGEAAQALTPNSDLVVVSGVGHLPEDEDPDTFNKAALEFFAKADAKRGA
jgi:pimeloyl-ACP methyl ester carboxylesterase